MTSETHSQVANSFGAFASFSAEIRLKKADFIVRIKDKTNQRFHHLFSDRTKRDEIVEIERLEHFGVRAHQPTNI